MNFNDRERYGYLSISTTSGVAPAENRVSLVSKTGCRTSCCSSRDLWSFVGGL